jgi:hypothetical protein
VALRGASVVQTLADHKLIAEHARHTERRLVIDPARYAGPGGAQVRSPSTSPS